MKQIILYPWHSTTRAEFIQALKSNPEQATLVKGNDIVKSKMRFNVEPNRNDCSSLHEFKDYEITIKCSDGDATIVLDDGKFVFIEDSNVQELSKYEFILNEIQEEEKTEPTRQQRQQMAKPRKPFKFR